MRKKQNQRRDHHHISMDALQQQIQEAIALQGFAIRQVLATEQEPAFAYTVGLHTPGTQRPEILISGLSPLTRVKGLLEIGFQIQGPPPLKTRRQLARLHGIEPTFPSGGRTFGSGERIQDLDSHGLPLLFLPLAQEHYETHLGQALVFHGHESFPCLQLLWPDPQGRFPWEAGFDESWRNRQQLLCDYTTLSQSDERTRSMTNPSGEQAPRSHESDELEPTPQEQEPEELADISRYLEATAPKDLMDLQARKDLWQKLLRLLRDHGKDQPRETDHP